MTLTPRQEAFAKAFVETGNASEAYRKAGYSTAQSDKSIHENASKLLAKVQPRLAELQQRAQKRHDVTIDTITTMLKEDRDLARKNVQTSAAVAAAMGLAKLHGLILDKSQISGDEDNPIVTRVELVPVEPHRSSH